MLYVVRPATYSMYSTGTVRSLVQKVFDTPLSGGGSLA